MGTESWIGFLPLLLVLVIAGLIWAKVRRNAQKAPPVAARTPIPEYRGPLAFFRRHYNGDYSLGRSYWVNTFLVSLFAPAVGLILQPWLSANFPARYASTSFLLITTLGIASWFWAVAGTWASANKHVQRGGKSGWATAAKFMIVMGALKTFGDVGNLMPALQEHIHIATGAQLGSATKIEVRADGLSILLSGGINDGSAEQLEKGLEMAPAVNTVVFSSEGGWIREGQMLADVIRKRGLNTYVEGLCASACTIAFLAGKERAADPGAKIGFHASRMVGSTESRSSSAETALIAAAYRTAGLPDAFIRQVIDTPYGKMWYPSQKELLAAGVLTRTSMGGETAALSTMVRSREMLVAEFRKIEVYAVLVARSPQDFDRVIDAAWDKMRKGATDAEVTMAARAELMVILPKFLRLATDETLIAYQALMQEELEALSERNARACAEMAFPSGQGMNVAAYVPPELVKRELGMMVKMLREADATRAIKPTRRVVESVARQAAVNMTQEQIVVFSDESARRRSEPALTCRAAIAFFSGLNAIPASDRGRAIRVLYSGV